MEKDTREFTKKIFVIQNAGCSISFLLCRDSYSYSITSDAIYPFITLATISLEQHHLYDFRLKVSENKNLRNVLDRVFFIQSKSLRKWLTCEVWQNQDLYTRKKCGKHYTRQIPFVCIGFRHRRWLHADLTNKNRLSANWGKSTAV